MKHKWTFTRALNLFAFIFCGSAAVAHFAMGNIGWGFFNLTLSGMNLVFVLVPRID